jgi:hypothetical protein
VKIGKRDTNFFAIKGSLVYPYFVAVILSVVLIYISNLKGDPTVKIVVLLAILLPFYYFFLELAYRKVRVMEDKILIKKFFRKKVISKDDVRMVHAAKFKNKTYIVLDLGDKNPIIISNSYGRFGKMVEKISVFVGEGKVSDTLKNLPKSSYKRISDTLNVWAAILLLTAIIIVRLLER